VSPPSNKDKYIAQAQKLVEKGQFDKAIREYLKAVAEDDTDIRIWIRIGDLYVKQGQKNEATENYKKVAQLYQQQGETDKAAAVYRQIQAIAPQLADAYIALGQILRDQGRAAQAIQQYEQAAELLARQGKGRDALLAEQAIVDLSPESVARRIRLAELYSRQNLYADAAREFAAAAMHLRKAGRKEEFIKVSERLLFHTPDNVEILKELARCHLEQGDGLRALTRLQAGFNLNGRDAETLDMLAQAFVVLGKPDKAIAVLKELAHIYTQRGSSPLAVYQRILQLSPDDAEARAGLTQAAGLQHSESHSGSLRAMILSSPQAGGLSPSGGTPLSPSMMSNRLVTPASGTAASAQLTPAAGTVMAHVGQAPGQVEDEAANIIAETESFLRFGLSKRAQDHLQSALSRKPDLKLVRERLIKLHESQREYKSAITELRVLLSQCTDVQEEVRYLREILRLDDRDQAAKRRLTVITGTHRIDLSMVDEPDEPEISLGDEEDAARRGWTAADRDTSEVPLADYREISESKRSQPERADGWAANDAASTAEVPVVDFKHYVDKSKPDAQLDPSRSGEVRKVNIPRRRGEQSVPDSAVPVEMGAQPTRPNPVEVEAVAEQMALTSGTLKEELAEVDFFLQQRSFDDAQRLLGKLLTRYPHSKSVQARQARLQEQQAVGSISDEVVIDVDMDDVREEVILSPSQQSLAPALGSGLTPAGSQISSLAGGAANAVRSPSPPPTAEVRRTIPPPVADVRRTIPPPVADIRRTIPPPVADVRRTIPPPVADVRRTIPPPVADIRRTIPPPTGELRRTLPPEFASQTSPPSATSVRASQRSLPPPPPRPSRIMKAIQLPPEGASDGVPKPVSPSESSGAFRLAVSLRNRGQYEQAIAEFEKCLSDDRRAARATLMIGLCHRDQNRVRDAVEAFKLGIHMPGVGDGDLAELNYQLGRSYELLSDPREAIHFYQAAMKRDGRFRDAADRIAVLQRNPPAK
jgi:tetratricopeptide (TPR) repeat protein